MPVLCQQLPPHLHVAVFHPRQLAVVVGPSGVSFGPGQLPVEEGSVGLVFEMVQPFVRGRLGGGGGHRCMITAGRRGSREAGKWECRESVRGER
jgi:hypothetical protein